jgi:hypothetical protein
VFVKLGIRGNAAKSTEATLLPCSADERIGAHLITNIRRHSDVPYVYLR